MKDIFFGPDHEKLHGVIIHAERDGAPAVVLCHPHPQFGGSMNNNVILGMEAALADADFTTLRFDFRGVGRSRGVYGDGIGEVEDVNRAIAFLAADASIGGIYIAGYSFGAAVGLKAGAAADRVAALVGVAPPTMMYSFDFLCEYKKPLLLAAGSLDEFCDTDSLRPFAEQQGARIEIIPGADHFFIGNEVKTGGIVRDFLSEIETGKE
ncbi:MAG: alpha/beta fold hydrolase [bacterium]